jgi:hypothetical protein
LAAIEPDASMMNTVCSLRGASVTRTGRATASARSTTASSWRKRRTLGRSRCHGVAADTGWATERHR